MIDKIRKLLSRRKFSKIPSQVFKPDNLPLLTIILSLLAVAVSFYASAERVFFIYDPYTIEMSALSVSDMEKAALREEKILESFEAFPETAWGIAEKILSGRPESVVIVTSWLYTAGGFGPAVAGAERSGTLFLFGPLFDYSRDYPGLAVSEEFLFPQDFAAGAGAKAGGAEGSADAGAADAGGGNSGLPAGMKSIVFYLPEAVYQREKMPEPEKGMIDALSEKFLEKNPSASIILRETGESGSFQPEKRELSVFCRRTMDVSLLRSITGHEKNTVFFDFINFSKKIATPSGRAPTETILTPPLFFSYEHERSAKKILSGRAAETAGRGVEGVYAPVFSFYGTP